MKGNASLYSVFTKPENCPYWNKYENTPELKEIVTFKLSKKIPIHNWFDYKQGFSPPLVKKFIQESSLKKDSVVLDPFCGVGTTCLESYQMGFNTIGVDILPLAVFVTKVKIRNDFNTQDIKKSLEKVLVIPLEKPSSNWPDVKIVNLAFTKEQQKEILVYKERILNLKAESSRDFLFLSLLSVIGEISKTKKDGGFLRIQKDIPNKSLNNILRKKTLKMVKEIEQQKLEHTQKIYNNNYKIFQGDSRDLNFIQKNSVDLVITSPPYLNKTDYTRIYSLELCLGFIQTFDELRTIRYNSFHSHVEAKNIRNQVVTLPDSLIRNLEELNRRPLTNPSHPEMIIGYFNDVHLTFKELYRVMKDNSKIFFVVWNSRFSGITFEVDSICGEIAEKVGFSVDKILVARNKGGSAQQNSLYGEKPLRESVVVLSK